MNDGHMMVRELDQATMVDRCGNGQEILPDELLDELSGQGVEVEPSPPGVADAVDWTTVDVVVGYGGEARSAQGGYAQIEALIISAVDRMNTAFSNSLINNKQVALLGTIEDPDYDYPGVSSGNMGEELTDLRSTTNGTLDTVSDYGSLLGADLVAFVPRSADGSAGIAQRPGRYSITARTYMTSTRLTFAHELGHNLGCDHSWGDSSQSNYSHYGWRLDFDGDPTTTNDRVRTIMAYDWGWGSGARIPYYANPAVTYPTSGTNVAPTGAPNRHDVRNDTRGDQRYLQNGLNYDNGNFGFDGTRASLRARNFDTIDTGNGVSTYGAVRASNYVPRTSFNVTRAFSF